jgi:hypothetical protein
MAGRRLRYGTMGPWRSRRSNSPRPSFAKSHDMPRPVQRPHCRFSKPPVPAICGRTRSSRAAGAAYLHPLAKSTQVNHILGSAAHAARAFELSTGDDPTHHLARSRAAANGVVTDVLRRYAAAPPGGARVGELMRRLDTSLR